MCANLVAQITEQPVFEFIAPRFGVENQLLLLVELVCEVALRGDHCLLADVLLGYLVEMRLGDLDVIAELAIELDFQTRYVQPFTFTRLQISEPLLALSHLLSVYIQVFGPAVPEHASIPDGVRLLC